MMTNNVDNLPPGTVILSSEALAQIAITPMYYAFSVVGALAERGLIDPLRVADFADMFASGQTHGQDSTETARSAITNRLKEFSDIIRAMMTAPPGAGRG